MPKDAANLREIEVALKGSEARLSLIVESVRDYAILSLTNDGTISSWNSGAERLFGLTPDRAIGQHTRVLFTPEDLAAGAPESEMQAAAANGQAEDERWHLRADGRRFYASGILFPLLVDDRLTGFVKVVRDVTDRKLHADALEDRVRERTIDLRQAIDALQGEVRDRRNAEAETRAVLKQLLTAQEEERRRMARNVHDQVGQQITALRITLASVASSVPPGTAADEAARRAELLAAELDATIDALGWQLRPPSLDHFGLAAAIGQLVRGWTERSDLRGEFDASTFQDSRLGPDVEANLYYIAQEALHNVVKHAQASCVSVFLGKRSKHVVLIIEDDGRGMDEGQASRRGPGLGLTNMRERAAIVGGEIEIESTPGKGTTVFVRVPTNS